MRVVLAFELELWARRNGVGGGASALIVPIIGAALLLAFAFLGALTAAILSAPQLPTFASPVAAATIEACVIVCLAHGLLARGIRRADAHRSPLRSLLCEGAACAPSAIAFARAGLMPGLGIVVATLLGAAAAAVLARRDEPAWPLALLGVIAAGLAGAVLLRRILHPSPTTAPRWWLACSIAVVLGSSAGFPLQSLVASLGELLSDPTAFDSALTELEDIASAGLAPASFVALLSVPIAVIVVRFDRTRHAAGHSSARAYRASPSWPRAWFAVATRPIGRGAPLLRALITVSLAIGCTMTVAGLRGAKLAGDASLSLGAVAAGFVVVACAALSVHASPHHVKELLSLRRAEVDSARPALSYLFVSGALVAAPAAPIAIGCAMLLGSAAPVVTVLAAALAATATLMLVSVLLPAPLRMPDGTIEPELPALLAVSVIPLGIGALSSLAPLLLWPLVIVAAAAFLTSGFVFARNVRPW